MTDHIHYPAHVDHPISHTASIGRLSIGIVAAAAAAVAIVYTGGGAAILAFGALGSVSTVGSAGMTLGKFYDQYVAPPVDTCFVKSGLDSVRLGPEVKAAARADHDDSLVRGAHEGEKFAEGSRIVMLGPEIRPMSRVGDRTDCAGVISDGIRSIVVGGAPSREGEPIDEKDSLAVRALTAVFTAAGIVSSVGKGEMVGAGLDTIGYLAGGDVEQVIGAGRSLKVPDGPADMIGQGDRAVQVGQRLIEIFGR